MSFGCFIPGYIESQRGKIAAENVSGSNEVANPLKDEWGTEAEQRMAERTMLQLVG